MGRFVDLRKSHRADVSSLTHQSYVVCPAFSYPLTATSHYNSIKHDFGLSNLQTRLVMTGRMCSIQEVAVANTDEPRKRDDNPFKPARLTPATLRNDPARSITPSKITASAFSMTPVEDHSNPAAPLDETRFDFSPLQESRHSLRAETSRIFDLTPIPVTPMQMQELRERRARAREIGWTIDSAKIRIQF